MHPSTGNRRLPAEANARILLCRTPTRQLHLVHVLPGLHVQVRRKVPLCRPHIRQIPSVYIQATLSNNISAVSTHNLYNCKPMRIHPVFSATFGRCKTLLARASASYEIVHTPHIDRADSAGPDYSQLYSTHTSPDERSYSRTFANISNFPMATLLSQAKTAENVIIISRPPPTAAPAHRNTA